MSKRVTMKEMADILGVSINAVSLALNNKPGVGDDLRKAVLDLAQKCGYLEKKQRYVHTYKNNNICIVINRRFFSSSDFYSQVLLGTQEEADTQSMGTLLHTFDEENFQVPDYIRLGMISGIVCIGYIPPTYFEELISYQLPIITVDYQSYHKNVDSIMTANIEGTYVVCDYLLSRGYETIGYFGDLNYSISVLERYNGILSRLRDRYPNWTHSQLVQELERYSILDSVEEYIVNRMYELTIEKLKKLQTLPEVFVCSNDEAANHLMTCLRNMHYKIPEDIAITGFDDSFIASRTTPALTTVHVEMKVLGREGVRRLLWRAKNPGALSTRTSIQTKLLVRASTK